VVAVVVVVVVVVEEVEAVVGGQVMSFESPGHCPGPLQGLQPHYLLRNVSCLGPEVQIYLQWSHYEV
jgi:hypothetical protein